MGRASGWPCAAEERGRRIGDTVALVDRMGGSVEVDDAPEGGAAFILTMPLDVQLGT